MKKLLSLPKTIIKLPKKILIPLIIVIIIGGWFILSSRNKQTPPEFVTISRQDLKSTISASGILTGKDQANLKFKSPGKLAYLNFKTGDTVKAGQTIAGLDTQDLNIALQQASNSYRDRQAIVDRILDDLKDHSSDETLTQKQTRTTAEVARDNAYDAVKAAQRAFQDAVIVSPITGIIVNQANLTPGQNVSVTDLIAQVVDFSEKDFSADVDESDISKVSLNQPVEITLNAYGEQVFPGKVVEITPQTKTSSSGATTITVKISVNSDAIHPIYGLNGQANIITAQAKHVISIPQEALAEGDQVVVKTNNQLEIKKISTGLKSDTDVEVTSGLQENDQVMKNPQSYIDQQAAKKSNTVSRLFGKS